MTTETLNQLYGPIFLMVLAFAVFEMVFMDRLLGAVDRRENEMIAKGMLVTLALSSLFIALGRPLAVGYVAVYGADLIQWQVAEAFHWYGWVIGFVVYEFCYWLQHWAGHKVRLLWCVHAPHHSPNTINMLVGFNHSFIETLVYMPLMLGLLPALLGIDPIIIICISLLDFVWGSFLHVSENLVGKRYGVLEKFMQTPSYHRAHHAKNLEYMDTNYNSITLLWDTLFATKVSLKEDNAPIYGVTSEVDTGSYINTHFGQFKKLWLDVKKAPTLNAKLGYLFMPPGWSHTGEHSTVSAQKKAAGLQGVSRSTPNIQI